MNLNAIKSIYKFNQEAGFLDKPIDIKLEASMSIEESLEPFSVVPIAELVNSHESPKAVSRELVALLEPLNSTTEVDLFDAYLDNIVINFGSIFKLGLTPQQAMKGLQIVATANMQKLGAGRDEHGKQRKPADFISPEPLLQLILSERS